MKGLRISKEDIFLRVVVPIAYFCWAITVPYLSLPTPDVAPSGSVHIIPPERQGYRIIDGTSGLTSAIGLNVNLMILIFLVLVVILQMSTPWHAHPIYDTGVNLIISSAILFAWHLYLTSIIAPFSSWDPIVDSTIPIVGMIFVLADRIFIPLSGKKILQAIQLPAD